MNGRLDTQTRAHGRSGRRLGTVSPVHLALGVWVVFTLGLIGCGNPSVHYGGSSTSDTPAATAMATPVRPTAVATPPAGLPHGFTPCKILSNAIGATADAIVRTHGTSVACQSNFAGAMILQVIGRSSALRPGDVVDARPGYMVCAPPAGHTGPYCGAALTPGDDDFKTSYAANWRLYPFPAADAKEVGRAAPFYQCIGNDRQLWTFHLETFAYTPGCNVPPTTLTTACDSFMYIGATDLQAYQYGKPAACAMFGSVIMGIEDGEPQPGVEICTAPAGSDSWSLFHYCSLRLGEPPTTGHWQSVAIPVASGPVDHATFDTAAGTACVTVGGQAFTFTLASMAVTPGCRAAQAATPTP